MDYRLLIVKNRFTKKYDFSKGLKWFKDHTPLKITVEEISTDFDLTFSSIGNATYKGWAVHRDIKNKLKPLIPENKYNCVVLLYGNKSDGIRVSVADNEPLYENTDFVQVVKISDKGLTFNHEIMHALFYKANRRGANIQDPMDSVVVGGKVKEYYRDKSLGAKESNRTIALERLLPHWEKVATLQKKSDVVLTRTKCSNKQTLGKLEAYMGTATMTCNTLELPWLANKSNISCIPTGTYKVAWTFSPRFMRFTYEVLNVPNRSGIRFHSGNFYTNIQGCILLGAGLSHLNNDGELDVTSTRVTISAFENFMGKKSFTLEIR